MVRGFETGSDNEKIDELQKQFSDMIDSQLNSVGGNDNIQINSSRGARNDASGDAGGVRSNQPVIHNITDVDTGGISTGIFDKINLISSMIIVDWDQAGTIELRFIQGTTKDGSKIALILKLPSEKASTCLTKIQSSLTAKLPSGFTIARASK